MKGVKWYNGSYRLQWELAILNARRAWHAVKAKCSSGGDVQLSPKLVSIIDASFEHTSWDALMAHLSDPATPFTLCHGDFHAANMILSAPPVAEASNGDIVPARVCDVIMFDWSEVGPWEGTYDLAQMIVSDVRPAVFKACSRNAVRAYWEALTAPGPGAVDPASYSFDACWSSFCRGGAERWIWSFPLLASMPLPGAIIQHFHNQLLEFIESHEPQPYYELKAVVCLW